MQTGRWTIQHMAVFRTTDGRLVGFRPRVLFKSSDFNDLPTKLSPHGGTVGMARNSRLRYAEGPTEGHVRATVTLRRWPVQSRLRWILSVTGIFRQQRLCGAETPRLF